MLKNTNKFLFYKSNVILSILFSFITILGNSYKIHSTTIKNIIFFFLYFFIYLFILIFTEILMKKICNKQKCNKVTYFVFEKHPFIIPFIIILIFWLPFIIIKFPAEPGWDFHNIIDSYYNHKLSSHFPIFYTYMCISITKLGTYFFSNQIGLFIISLIHLLPMLTSFSIIFVYLKKWNINYKFRYALLLFYSLNILFSCYSIVLYADTIFSSLLLIYILILTDFINNNINTSKVFIIILLSFFICQLKNNGILIILPTTIYLLFKLKLSYKLLIVLPIIISYNLNTYYKYRYPSSNITALSIPLQQISRYSLKYHDDISKEDLKNINTILDYEKASTSYNPISVDDVVNNAINNYYYSKKDLNVFFKSYIHLFFKHPTVYIEAFFYNNYNLYYPYENSSYLIFRKDNLEHHITFNRNDKALDKLTNYVSTLNNIYFVKYIDEAGFYVWILLFIISIIIKYKLNIIPVTPLIIVLITCLFGPTIFLHTRYAFSIIFSVLPLYSYYSKKISDLI